MRTHLTLILIGVLVLHIPLCQAQEQYRISKPMLDTLGDNLIITYDILNSKPGDKFEISISISDSKGYLINAFSLSGDLGESIEGGSNKKIRWNFTNDNVTEEIMINVKIIAEKLQQEPHRITPAPPSYSRSELILQSIALPGLGRSKIHNKPHWLLGVAGYGLIANSIYFQLQANENYTNYELSDVTSERQDYRDKYEQQQWISTISVAGAAAIWITDFILVFRASSKYHKTRSISHFNRMTINPDYNFYANSPMLTLKINF